MVPGQPTTQPRRQIRVGLGEMQTSDDPNTLLVAFGLGSCVALVVWDSKKRVGAMAHVALPEAGDGADRPLSKYADTAVAHLLDVLRGYDVHKRHLVVKIAGGASIVREPDAVDHFNIGQRNVDMIRRALAHHNRPISGED